MTSPFTAPQRALAEKVLSAARAQKVMLTTAESCTGGLIAACLTEIAGSSDVFDCGFASYSYEAKTAQLGVSAKTIATNGAVSEETALEMASGALGASRAQLSVAVTGIAGPGGATPGKPVGLVYIAVGDARDGSVIAHKQNFAGDRSAVRAQTLETALALLLEKIG